jgi:predicted DNA-binding transcriptional regulator AlpA
VLLRAPRGTPIAMPSAMAQLLSERDASRRLGLSVRTLQKWRLQGNGPPFLKLGHAVRYDPEDLDAYVARARRRSTSDRAQEHSVREPGRGAAGAPADGR